jgi:IQ calmodulin-binding motif
MPALLFQPANTMNTSIAAPYHGKHAKIGFSPRSVSRPSVQQKDIIYKLPPLKSCGELADNSVFLHRFHVAATTIQCVVRGNAGRRAARMAKKERQTRHTALLVLARRDKAATKLQAMTRGAMLRSHFACRKLVIQLERIELAKRRELDEIQAWKNEQTRLIKADFDKKRSALQKKAKKQQADFDMAKKIINYLRAENKKLRERNEALRSAIEKMIAENKLLSKESSSVSLNCGKLSSGMMQINGQNGFLKSVAQQMEKQIEAFEEAIQIRDDAIMTENRMGRGYFNSIQSMVLTIDDVSDDSNLIDKIDEMYEKMHNNRGLEETERDLTENFS